ncbi:MAG: asparaginase [Burkholderiales bacterium PBB6]|nr:MAG: asparaginase [Burkholderiales bacterium PBB6]
MSNPVLVDVQRGGVTESFHQGACAVVDATGTVVHALGNIERAIFPRSAVKVLQALPLITSGAADLFQLTDTELALACASHNGEPAHAATAAGMLAKAGVDATALGCGSHWPSHDRSSRELARSGGDPTALHNNCSGKHAGLVCLGCLLAREQGLDARGFLSGYVQPDHPVMQQVTHALATATSTDLRQAPVGVDGCSIPTFGMPLRQLALGFARVATGQGLSADHARAAARLRKAVASAPFMVAGTDRFDTDVMAHFGERVFCKVGAEGVYCAALPELGWGVAIKMDDGNNARAVEVVMAHLLATWVARSEADHAVLAPRTTVHMRNWNGIEVGTLQPSAELLAATRT